MGLRRALKYQCALIIPLLAMWWWTTSAVSAAFSPLPILRKVDQMTPFPFAKALTISLTLLYDGPTALPTDSLESDLAHFMAQLSHFMDVKLQLQSAFIEKVCCENCQGKLDPFSPYFAPLNLESQRDHLRLFAIVTNKECEPLPIERTVYVKKQSIGRVATYVVEMTREFLGLETAPGTDLINGFTTEEAHGLQKKLETRLVEWVSYQANLMNALMESNTPAVTKAVSVRIEHVRKLLAATDDYEKLLEAAGHLESLISDPSLAKEEYFQPDFKVGVYAPLLVPPIFPLVGVAYSYWTRRKRV